MPDIQVKLSIVIPVRRSAATIRNTLDSLLPQCHGRPVEVVVVVSSGDDTVSTVTRYEDPKLRVEISPGSWSVPQLRCDGVRLARGSWIIITEDHCTFPPGWVAAFEHHLNSEGPVVLGGPVENGIKTALGWALYFNRYSHFLWPAQNGEVDALPGNSACYPAETLYEHRALWKDGFWEAEINQALRRHRVKLISNGDLRVTQNQSRGFCEYTALRFRHGRCYGSRRINGQKLGAKLMLLLQSPLVPPLLYLRAGVAIFRKKTNRAKFLTVTPFLAAYYFAWSAGEIVGYLFGAGTSLFETD